MTSIYKILKNGHFDIILSVQASKKKFWGKNYIYTHIPPQRNPHLCLKTVAFAYISKKTKIILVLINPTYLKD